MNKVFKESNKIVLDDKFYLEPDQFKGLVLVFHEMRERKKKDKTTETYEFEDRFYHPTLSQTLRKYMTLKVNYANCINELHTIVSQLEIKIDSL